MITRHVVINPTWRCQLACPYCWLPACGKDRKASELAPVTWERWVEGVAMHAAPGSWVDISGGEPLLYPGIIDMLYGFASRQIRWALTTNGVALAVIEEIVRRRVPGCAQVNISAHAQNENWQQAAIMFRVGGYRTSINLVDHAGAPESPFAANVPYQAWAEGDAVDGIRRTCNAGFRHWFADAVGDVWQCSVAMQLGRAPIGNLFDGKPLLLEDDVQRVCDWGCASCYVQGGSDWGVTMQEVTP